MEIYIQNKPYTGPVRAVILDWAGTAVDYGCMGPVAVFADVFKKYKVDVSMSEARKFMGLMKKDHIRGMCGLPSVTEKWIAAHGREPDESDVESMYRDTEAMMVSAIARHADIIPGVIETVAELRKRGIKIGSSTGYTGPMMAVLVPEAEKKGYKPDSIVCSTDVPAGRPYPWMCYRNAINLGVYPMSAIIKIGDTVADIQEGLNAGVWTIGLSKSGNELGMTQDEVNAMDERDLKARLEDIGLRFRQTGAHYVAESITDCIAIIDDINARLAKGENPLPKI